MFAQHQHKISAYARQNPDNFKRVLKFVVLTIRVRLANIPADMETLDSAENGGGDGGIDAVLYGFKAAAVAQIDADAESLYWQAESIVYHAETERDAARELIRLFATIHGLGLAKSGFAAQLIYGCGGCLDTHNLERFDINPNQIKSSRYKYAKTLKTKTKLIENYLDLCDKFGGCESLWDSWCDFLAAKSGIYADGWQVSALHCECLGIETN